MYTRTTMLPRRLAAFVLAPAVSLGLLSRPLAQPARVEAGHAELGLALRRLDTVGTFMMMTAHPDDEDNGLLAALGRGQGIRTVLVTATRGDGGQNEIGAELFDALAVLRTEELLAAHRHDGAEQYFTRAVDFGYSFSLDETFEKWGREEILADFVRMIRTIRPDVVAGLSPEGDGGGQHHQASALLAEEAFRAAADPSAFKDQVTEGLRPWQAKKFYFRAGFGFGGGPGGRGGGPGGGPGGGRGGFDDGGFGGRGGGRVPTPAPGLCIVDVGRFDPLIGRTYAEVGSLARSMHKCQGMSQIVALPGPASALYRLAASTIEGQIDKAETSLFDGIETSLASLARFAGARPPRELTLALTSIARHTRAANEAFGRGSTADTATALMAGLTAVRNLRGQLVAIDLAADARYEIDFRLAQKEDQFARAAALAHGLRVEILAGDGLVTPDQPVSLSALVANHGTRSVVVTGIVFEGFEGSAVSCGTDVLDANGVYRCSAELRIPKDALLSDIHWTHEPGAARYAFDPDVPFGLPFPSTPFRATVELDLPGGRITMDQPVEYRYAADIFAGEKRTALHVVPRFAVRVTPDIAIIPAGRLEARELRVTVANSSTGAASGDVSLEAPPGWHAEPERARVEFTREDEEQTLRVSVTPGEDVQPGAYPVRAIVSSADGRFDRGYQVVEYPHTGRRHLVHPAETEIRVLDVAATPGLTVGYVMGVGDQVPQAIEQLGAKVEQIGTDMLAWGDLSRFDVIVTGVRAYERRVDLRANNERLIQYVTDGGTVIVQYNKFEFNDAQYGPYPAQVSGNRVTDEEAPVRILANDHPVFAVPNRIDESTWAGWVQERGLYFLGEKDERYVDLVELEDAFENNPGVKRGALVEAPVGEGRWIYVGLGLWRQLPAGTPGAYELLANLLSLGAPPARSNTAGR